jgi:ribonuclease Z
MPLCLRFLGTSAARPTVERNVASIALLREGEAFLFDCGEGTQRQMMRYGITFNIDDVFFTHFHTDHLLGIVGLLRTLSLQGRTESLRLWGPVGAERVLRRAESFGSERLSFGLDIGELAAGDAIPRKGYLIHTFAMDHRGPVPGLRAGRPQRLGRFNPERAAELGIPEGPLWGRLHKGETVTLDDGRVIEPSSLVGETRPGRRVVITGDTRPCAATIMAAEGADLLVHESTFGDEGPIGCGDRAPTPAKRLRSPKWLESSSWFLHTCPPGTPGKQANWSRKRSRCSRRLALRAMDSRSTSRFETAMSDQRSAISDQRNPRRQITIRAHHHAAAEQPAQVVVTQRVHQRFRRKTLSQVGRSR